MNKKFINGLLLATLMVGSAGSFTSCKDYDDDINDLQGQIDKINVTLGELQEKIKSGSVITNVTSNNDGLVFTLSDGKTYTITNGKNGADGKPGEAGAPGTSWSIGADGYWYKDGEKTEYKAVPDAGAAGSQGPAGPAGPQGPAGKYYVPNEDGYFWIHDGDKDPEKTNISWVAAGPTAAFDGLTLVLSNLKGANGETLAPVTIECGKNVTSIAFIPNRYVNGVPAVSFYTLSNKVLKVKNNAWTTSDGDPLNVSNTEAMSYRLNPKDALIADNASVSFIDRKVTGIVARAAGDDNKLLAGSIVEKNKDGEMIVDANINLKAYNAIINDKNGSRVNDPIVALALTNGQSVVASDYVYVEQAPVSAILVDSALTVKDKAANKTTVASIVAGQASQGSNESTTAYVDRMAKASLGKLSMNVVPAIAELAYDGTLDLQNVVALYTNNASPFKNNFLSALGFDNVSYKFSKVEKYMIGNTDQEYFVDLNGSVLSVRNDIGGKTQAIGRTPVIYVEAFVDGKLVAAAFVKIAIKEALGNKDGIEVVIPAPADNYDYPTVAVPLSVGNDKTNQNVGLLTWQDINKEIYGALGTDADAFKANYKAPVITVSVPVTWNKGAKSDVAVYELSQLRSISDVNKAYAKQYNWYNNELPGLYVDANIGGSETTTIAPINVWINNQIHTQDGTIKNAVNAKGESLNGGAAVNIAGAAATYTVTITYNPTDAIHNGPVVLTRTFTVTEPHNAPIYSNFVANDKVVSYGALNAGRTAYEMMFQLTNAFKRGTTAAGVEQDVFTFFAPNATQTDAKLYNLISNVKGIQITGVTLPTTKIQNTTYNLVNAQLANGSNVAIPAATASNYGNVCNTVRNLKVNNAPAQNMIGLWYLPSTTTVKFKLTLANGEVCSKEYTLAVEFNNPFVGTTANALTLNGNAPQAAPLNVKPSILVNDHVGNKILSWEATAWDKDGNVTARGLVLSAVAKANTGYAVSDYDLSYDFDQASKDYIAGMAQGELKIDNANGNVTYIPGATLTQPKTLTIEVTATFESTAGNAISVVLCEIPLTLTTGN